MLGEYRAVKDIASSSASASSAPRGPLAIKGAASGGPLAIEAGPSSSSSGASEESESHAPSPRPTTASAASASRGGVSAMERAIESLEPELSSLRLSLSLSLSLFFLPSHHVHSLSVLCNHTNLSFKRSM